MQTADLKNHSEEMQQIISAPPSWMMKWGVSVFVTILIILGSLSYYIHYPDTIKARLVVYQYGSFKPVKAPADGTVEAVLIPANGPVKAGQTVIYLEAKIDHQAVNTLYERAVKLRSSRTVIPSPKRRLFLHDYQQLFGALPGAENFLSAKGQQGNHRPIDQLIAAIGQWQTRYQVSAPRDGKVIWIRSRNEGAPVFKGQSLFYVTGPEKSLAYYGELHIGQKDMAKVMIGQKVIIKLDRYDHQDFGLVTGTLASVDQLPESDSFYTATVQINTPANRKIALKPGLAAQAEIITQDISLMKRLTQSITRSLSGR